MDLNMSFSMLGTLPLKHDDGSEIDSFGAFAKDTNGNVTFYIGVTELAQTVYFNSAQKLCKIYEPNEAPSDPIIDAILSTISSANGAKDIVPTKYHYVLGM